MQLEEYFQHLGLPEDTWHIGPEHPGLERLALTLLARKSQTRVLELGVQAGGFAVPVILHASSWPAFSYTGVDNLEYTNAVPLRLIESYLRDNGVTAPLKFVEGDSTPVVKGAGRHAFDFILLDHYKPKYPLDLYLICSREVLSGQGTILLHDVLTHAAPDWKVCEQVCRAFGYRWTIDAEVPGGTAIVSRNAALQGTKLGQALVAIRVNVRWMAHATVLRTRRTVGGLLRSMGLRR